MDDADMIEVFKRLAERDKRFLDEAHQELVREEFRIEEPLFATRRTEMIG